MRRPMFILLSFVLLLGCVPNPDIVIKPPEPKAWTAEDLDAVVKMEEKSIYAPAPSDNGQPPAACDYIRYLSFTPKASDMEPDAVLMLAPGMDTGMGALTNLGRNLIYVAKTYHNANIQVLVAERRGNCLEDLTGVNAAEELQDINTAIDYYYNAKPINGKIFEGFVTNEQAPYLSEFGVKLNIEDFYKIITTEVPDPEIRRQKLFLAGHSISGLTMSIFAAWDFDGDPSTLDDAGYRNCAGFIALDTFITVDPEMNNALYDLFPEQMRTLLRNTITKSSYKSMVANLRSGKLSRILLPKILPESFMLTELSAMQADWAPNQESTLLDTVPYSENVDGYLKTILSGTYRDFMQPESAYKDIRCTNLALFGLLIDDNFNPSTGGSLSLGFLGNGKVADKNFPIPNMIDNFPAMSDMIQTLFPPSLYYPTEKASTLYKWANFDEFESSAFTTPEDEVVDIYDYIRGVYSGPTNYYEWYFPIRHFVDVTAVIEKGWIGDANHYRHTDYESKVPILKLVSEYGIVTPYPAANMDNSVFFKGYTHFDIVMASANRSSRPSKVVESILDFVLQ